MRDVGDRAKASEEFDIPKVAVSLDLYDFCKHVQRNFLVIRHYREGFLILCFWSQFK